MPAARTRFEEISPADFFYRYRDIAGFSNPARALFSAIRELVENALDACEAGGILPDIYLRLSLEEERDEVSIYRLRIEDNGSGVPGEHIPRAFGQVLYGSKYRLMQSRGMFGLGGAMAILYGQITTHKPVFVMSSTGGPKVYKYKLMIDIKANKPIVLEREVGENGDGWHGTVVEFCLEGDYSKASPKIIEYLRQTALVNPYANITFVDPRGRLYRFLRATEEMPPPPRETKPHPKGVDVELVRRMIASTNEETLLDFLTKHFQRVGPKTASRFLEFAGFEPDRSPRSLKPDEIVRLVRAMKEFDGFISPDASCLSPLGPELLEAGVRKELKPEFVAVCQRKPSAYGGHPFIVEVAIAYGGQVPSPRGGKITLYRFANRIPLLYDEASDVSRKIIDGLNWRRYRVSPDMPVAVVVHICSTRVPYKTVGKEFIADRPEVRHEITQAIREVARRLQLYLARKERKKAIMRRYSTFAKYLPMIAEFSAKLAGRPVPSVKPLLEQVRASGLEGEGAGEGSKEVSRSSEERFS